MSGINESPEYGDVLEDVAEQGSVTVSTTPVELTVNGSPEIERELIRIYNDGPQVCFIGYTSSVSSSGTNKGERLARRQWIEFPFGPDLTVYAVTASGSTTLIISELG